MKKQTATEWLLAKLESEFKFTFSSNILEEAKEIEKQRLEQFYNHGMWALVDGNGHGNTFEDYYNETFNSKEDEQKNH